MLFYYALLVVLSHAITSMGFDLFSTVEEDYRKENKTKKTTSVTVSHCQASSFVIPFFRVPLFSLFWGCDSETISHEMGRGKNGIPGIHSRQYPGIHSRQYTRPRPSVVVGRRYMDRHERDRLVVIAPPNGPFMHILY